MTTLNEIPAASANVSPLGSTLFNEFHREGFITVHNFLTADEVETLRIIYDGLFEDQAKEKRNHICVNQNGDKAGEASRYQIAHCSKYRPELKATRLYHQSLAVAKELLGPTTEFWGDFALLKPPNHGGPTPWHQDEAYWTPDLHFNHLAVWVPLQPATMENGCMQFVPRSHKKGIIEHRPLKDVGACATIEAYGFKESDAVACPIPPGDVTIHHSRTLHYTGPNTSNGPRRAYILNFGIPTTPKRFFKRKYSWRTEKPANNKSVPPAMS